MNLIAEHVGELLDSGPDALIVADESGVIAYVNRQTEVLLGYERNELRGKKVEMLLPERLRATHPSHRRSYGTNPRVRPMGGNLELYARRKDGSEFPVEISLSPIHTKQGLLISSTIRDVSDRHQILEDLPATKNEAERANRAKSTFLATASHDLRQPLQSLILLNSVLLKTCTDSRAIEAAAAQQEALASMAALVNALLDISKLECGAIKPLIDDEVAVARATQMLLELEGHAVLSARGLDSALASIEQHGSMPDLIVSDFHLGTNVSGIDVIRELREFAGLTIPAILVTGDTSPRLANTRNTENLAILSKPVDAAEFLDCIDRLLMSANPPQPLAFTHRDNKRETRGDWSVP